MRNHHLLLFLTKNAFQKYINLTELNIWKLITIADSNNTAAAVVGSRLYYYNSLIFTVWCDWD